MLRRQSSPACYWPFHQKRGRLPCGSLPLFCLMKPQRWKQEQRPPCLGERAPRIPAAVSYTHLDVYKRQASPWAALSCPRLSFPGHPPAISLFISRPPSIWGYPLSLPSCFSAVWTGSVPEGKNSRFPKKIPPPNFRGRDLLTNSLFARPSTALGGRSPHWAAL